MQYITLIRLSYHAGKRNTASSSCQKVTFFRQVTPYRITNLNQPEGGLSIRRIDFDTDKIFIGIAATQWGRDTVNARGLIQFKQGELS